VSAFKGQQELKRQFDIRDKRLLKMIKHNFKKLTIWSDSMDLCDLIYNYTDTLPNKEKYNLVNQLERCAVSVTSNIAEGSGKRTSVHFAEFLKTSLTSSYEIDTQLLICERRKYGNETELKSILNKVEVLQKQISNFRDKIISEK
jgi:four helix bundle protein